MIMWLRRLALTLPWVRRKREQSLNEELQSYMAMATDAARENGASVEDAWFEAKRDLGSAIRIQEEVRGERLLAGVERMMQDMRYACRTVPRAPLFTVVVVLSLALGIGSATAIFSLVEAVLLKPLTYPDAGRLLFIREAVPALAHIYPTLPVNIQHFFYWHDHTTAFQYMTAFRSERPTLGGAGQPVQVDGVEATADLFKVLGVDMWQGRGFLPGEDQPGRNHVAIITYSLWSRRFGLALDVIGRSILVDGSAGDRNRRSSSRFRFPQRKRSRAAGRAGQANRDLPSVAGQD